jgi:hypothetical protein
MKLRDAFRLLGCGLMLASLFASTQAQRQPATKPNILLIVADDLGYADIGVNGCQDVPTPHIEAAELDRHKLYLFTIFFSSPCRTIHRHKRHINVTRQNSASCTHNNHERIQVSNHSG